MKGLSLDKFKKVSEDHQSAILQHPDGHKIQIAKPALSEKMKKDLSGLPLHAADGALIENPGDKIASDALWSTKNLPTQQEYDQSRTRELYNKNLMANDKIDPSYYFEGDKPPKQFNPSAWTAAESQLKDQNMQAQQAGQQTQNDNAVRMRAGLEPVPVSGGMPQAPAQMQPQAAQATPGQAPMPQMPMAGDTMVAQGVKEGEQGIQAQQNSDVAVAAANSKIYADSLAKMAKAQSAYEAKVKPMFDSNQELMKEIQSGKVDPQQLWNNTGAANKVAVSIGLILGGIGGALTHQKNAAQEYMENAISNDVKAQMANMDNKKSLYQANLSAIKDEQTAHHMTVADINNALSLQVQKAVADNADPAAKARGLKLMSDLHLNAANAMQAADMRQQALAAAQNGAGDPSALVAALVPKEHQAKAFAEISNAQNSARVSDEILKKYDQAAKENTVLRTGAGLARTPASISELRALFLPIIHDAEGRVNEFEQKTLENLLPQPGDADAKVAEKKQGLMAFLHQKQSAPTARGYGINLENYSTTSTNPVMRMSPKEQQWMRWAQGNPKDPLAQAFMRKMGVR